MDRRAELQNADEQRGQKEREMDIIKARMEERQRVETWREARCLTLRVLNHPLSFFPPLSPSLWPSRSLFRPLSAARFQQGGEVRETYHCQITDD